MVNVIKTSGSPFSHDTSSCHGFKPSKFEWCHDDDYSSNVTVYFDFDHMGGFKNYAGFINNAEKMKFLVGGFKNNREKLKFLMGNFRNYGNLKKTNKERLKFLWLCESKAITGKVNDHVLKNADLFFDCYDTVFVHDRWMIEKDNRFKYLPNASNKHWVTNCGIHKKTKLVSMINSGKRMCKGHLARNKIVSTYKDKVDLFGLKYNPIRKKEDGLNDYMFSLVLENAQYKTYITEKLMDCFATGTIPIYQGAPDIGDYFNEDGIIKFTDKFNIDQLSEDLYRSKMDAIKDNFDRCMNVTLADDLLFEEVSKYLG